MYDMTLRTWRMLRGLPLCLSIVACGGASSIQQGEADQTSFVAPVEGSCEAKAMLTIANTFSETRMDDQVGLTPAAASSTTARRP